MPPSLPHAAKVTRLRRLSHLLDKAIPIPGTKLRFGLDPIIGLLPGGGDTVTGALSAYIVVEAARMGVPRNILGQMVGNILLDSAVGSIPVLGDLFDVGWKANVKNMVLLEKHLNLNLENKQVDRLFVCGLIAVLTLIIIGFATIAVLKLMRYIRQVLKISAHPFPFYLSPFPSHRDYCASLNREPLYYRSSTWMVVATG